MTTTVAVGDINQLPEECISQVISFTTPRDACVSSAVSGAFRSAADSDATWKQFLPSDCAAILSGAVEPLEYASTKELYMRLSDHPVLINGGSMFVAGYSAYRAIRSRTLSWRAKAIRIFPTILLPAAAAAYFLYSLFRRFTSTLKLKDSRSLERLERERKAESRQKLKGMAETIKARSDIQNNPGKSSSMTSPESKLPEVAQVMDKVVSPRPSQVANKPVAMDMVDGINQPPEDSTASDGSCPSPAVSHANQSSDSLGESSSMASSRSNLPLISPASDENMDLNLSQGIDRLPPDCISLVTSFTTPRDACVSSAVSHSFQSAANSDATWERFLPLDYAIVLSRAVDQPVEYASMKELYMRLCDHPMIIDDGLMSFGLDKLSGAKCFMIPARAMSIIWSNDSRYWAWVMLPFYESRFGGCAQLKFVWWLEMRGNVETRILTPHTTYAAYLIFKPTNSCRGFVKPLQSTTITMSGDVVSQHSVCLHPEEEGQQPGHEMGNDVKLPRDRGDGWMEIEMGYFYSGNGDDGEVDMAFMQVNCNYIKEGVLVEGIEVRPRHELNQVVGQPGTWPPLDPQKHIS